jgi:hypothetical protein
MNRFSKVLTITLVVAVVSMFSAPAAAEHAYVGAEGCKMCHTASSKGAQYKIWEKTKHAQAYASLASDKAKEVAAAKGIDNPQESPECLKCHVTGYGSDASLLEPTYSKEEGVSCESCHGPGKDYRKMKIMKDIDQAKDNGLILPDEEVCKKCHNEESPFYQPFNFDEQFPQIAHPRPDE